MTKILVPTLGESVSEATVAQWLKKEGEAVKADEPIVELETDKVTLEVPAPADGVIVKIMAAAGQSVGVGAALGAFEAGAGADDKGRAPQAVKAGPSPAQVAGGGVGGKNLPAGGKVLGGHKRGRTRGSG